MTSPPPEGEWWYCVMSKPAREAYAREHLERQQFECFLPYLQRRRLYRGKPQWVTKPMFPRYLFVRACPMELVSRIRSTQGVCKLVEFGDSLGRVPDQVVADIRARCEEDVLTQEAEQFAQGEKLRLSAGPYQGYEVIFCRPTSNEERVVILMEIMQAHAHVEIERAWLAREEAT